MTRRSHLISGCAAGAAVMSAYLAHGVGTGAWPGAPDRKSVVMIVTAGALYIAGLTLPDIDQNKIVRKAIGHRTWTHSVWPILAVLALAKALFLPLAGLAAGMSVHILMDSFSVCGVAWLYPFTNYRKYPGGATVKKGAHVFRLYRVGDKSERWVLIGVVVVCVVAAIGVWVPTVLHGRS